MPSLKVLLVEDDPEDALLTRRHLARSGHPYVLDIATTFDEGAAAIARGEHAAYLIDYRLDARVGAQLVHGAIAAGATAPFIMLTGLRDPEVDRASLDAGASDYLVKSELTPGLLDRAIRYAIERARVIRETRGVANALSASEARLRQVLDGSNDAFWSLDLRTGAVDWSPRWAELLGYEPGELVPSHSTWEALLHPDDLPRAGGDLTKLVKGELALFANEYRARRKDGTWLWLRGRGKVVARDDQGHPTRVAGANSDITAEKVARLALDRVNRARHVRSAGNASLLRARDERPFFREICKLLCEIGGYRMAWIGLASNDEARTLELASVAGVDDDAKAMASLCVNENAPRDPSPADAAIRTGRTQIGRIAAGSPGLTPWHAEALRRGYRASLALPLSTADHTFGAVQIYSEAEDAFDPHEVTLLEELAKDIAFGVDAIRVRSERERAEAALRASEARFRAMFEDAVVGMAICDERDCALEVNEALSSLLGRYRAELVGVSLLELTLDEDRATSRAQFEALVTGRVRHYDSERRFRADGGKVIWTRVGATSSRTPSGMVIVKIIEDVTARKQAEAMSRSLDLQQRALAKLGFGALSAPDFGAFEREAAEVVCEALPADLCGLFMPDDASGELALEQGSGWRTGPERARLPEHPLVRCAIEASGKVVSAEMGAALPALLASEGAIGALAIGANGGDERAGVLLAASRSLRVFAPEAKYFLEGVANIVSMSRRIHADMDRLRKSNADLASALERLARAQEESSRQERLRALGQLASGIAHDFNNHLMGILGFSEILLENPAARLDGDKSERYLKLIHTAAEGAAHVVKRLREFYRKRDETEPFAAVDLNALLASAVALAEPRWKDEARALGRTIAIEKDLAARGALVGNGAELRDAALNLILNAVDALTVGGTITVRSRDEGDDVIFEVADNGTGMPEAVRARCMEPFFTTKGDRGTGLGLSMVWGIVQRHNGTIAIQSEVGKGTTVTIRLPVGARAARPSGAIPVDRVRKRRVLVVDDSPEVLEVLGAYLEADDHAVTKAADGLEALQQLGRGSFDLIITDRSMPGMSGDQLAVEAHRTHPDIPILMITGFGDLIAANEDAIPGIDLVLGKPLTRAKVREALEKIDRRRPGPPPR